MGDSDDSDTNASDTASDDTSLLTEIIDLAGVLETEDSSSTTIVFLLGGGEGSKIGILMNQKSPKHGILTLSLPPKSTQKLQHKIYFHNT